ncbi:MAG TPA: hypothetical protein VN813_08515 [Luteibacter sp.]|jgi:hypothetical protein|nr:hypothetical protein [Luteibacter sp.]
MKYVALGLALLFATSTAAAGETGPAATDDLAPLVARLVDDTTKNAESENRAFNQLLLLGEAGVPYIIAHLGDARPLPEKSIWIHRRGGRPERQYQPWYVHDGLESVLKELTGFTKGPQTGHLLPSQRERSARKWVAWCVERYPAQAGVCQSVQR